MIINHVFGEGVGGSSCGLF